MECIVQCSSFFKVFLVVVQESPQGQCCLRGWCLGVGGVKADGLTGVGDGLAVVCWSSTVASGGGVSGIEQGGALTADSE